MQSIRSYTERLIRKIRSSLFYFTRIPERHTFDNSATYAIINFDDNFTTWDNGRYLYIACKYFEHAGFNVVVNVSYRYITSNAHLPYRTSLLEEKYSFVRNSTTAINSITLLTPGSTNKQMKISYGNNIRREHVDCLVPYPMHPNQYKAPSLLQATSLRTAERTIKVFFSGNAKEKLYNRDRLESTFNVISRFKVLTHLKAHFGPLSKIRIISDETALHQLLDAKQLENAVIISEARTRSEDWLKALSKSAFFIAPPGIFMPWSHNAIEAMAVGTIPILQYAHLFDPALTHLENCLSYNSFDELDQVVELALNMEPEKVTRMRNNVIDYFDNQLSLESVISKLNAFTASEKQQLKVGVPFVPGASGYK